VQRGEHQQQLERMPALRPGTAPAILDLAPQRHDPAPHRPADQQADHAAEHKRDVRRNHLHDRLPLRHGVRAGRAATPVPNTFRQAYFPAAGPASLGANAI
jgi:hypothetical protein